MAATYKIREVRVTVRSGVTVVADVGSIEALSALLSDLDVVNLAPVHKGRAAISEHESEGEVAASAPVTRQQDPTDSPAAGVERRVGIPAGSLTKANVLGFKNGVPQLQRPSAVSATDAILVLLYAVENGLQKAKIARDAFKAIYEAQNIKSGSPLRMKLTDLRNAGYIDKSAYAADKSLTLTAKGENKAIEVIKDLVGK
jgi:hypothetical protein